MTAYDVYNSLYLGTIHSSNFVRMRICHQMVGDLSNKNVDCLVGMWYQFYWNTTKSVWVKKRCRIRHIIQERCVLGICVICWWSANQNDWNPCKIAINFHIFSPCVAGIKHIISFWLTWLAFRMAWHMAHITVRETVWAQFVGLDRSVHNEIYILVNRFTYVQMRVNE